MKHLEGKKEKIHQHLASISKTGKSNFFYFFVFERQRETEHKRGRGRERENPKQALGSELSAQSLMRGLNS